MIIVIQCAAKKRSDAGLMRTTDGKPVLFVADPSKAPPTQRHLYARPDDPSGAGPTWREILLRYNQTPSENPFGLCPAYKLYENTVYGRLAERFGIERTYILSAGWGLIAADFLTPA